MIGPHDTLIPLRNNAAGKMTGLEVLIKDIDDHFPNNAHAKGYNVRRYDTIGVLGGCSGAVGRRFVFFFLVIVTNGFSKRFPT